MIGVHRVTCIPDPTTPVWGAPIASNPNLTTDLAGWQAGAFATAYTWAAPGVAKAPPVPAANAALGLFRSPAYPIARGSDAGALYRVRATVTVATYGWAIPTLYFGTTPDAATNGPFWFPNDAVGRAAWIYCPGPGTYTVETVIDPSDVNARYTYLGPNIDFYTESTVVPNMVVSVDSVELVKREMGTPVDITCLVDQVTIQHGREDTTSQPEASTATLDLSLDTGEDSLPDGLDIGAQITVATEVPGLVATRFVGYVTDVNLGWDEAGADTPEAVVCQVMATGRLGDLGRRVVGAEPWPVESDGARVARIASLAGVALDPLYSDVGTVQILARDVDKQAALELAQSVAQSAGGIVWQTRSGEVRYADANHRRAATAGLRIDACDVLVTPTWNRTTDGLLNTVAIGYGVADPEAEGGTGEQPRYTATNQSSVDRFGRYELSTATELAALADAQAMATLILNRNQRPVWIMSALPVDVAGLDTAETVSLLSLDLHQLLEVTGLPAVGTVPTATSLWVEGWTETLGFGTHDIELKVSGFCRTSPPPEWDRVPQVWTWDTAPNVTWDEAACFGPIQSVGRWVDQPATTRWDQLTPAQTWNTYTGATIPTGG